MNVQETSLLTKLQQNNCKAAIIPIHLLINLQQEMDELYNSGILSKNLIHKYLRHFYYDYSEVFPNAQSILITAVPQPMTILRFTYRKKEQRIVVPPTYIYTEAEKLVFNIVENELKKENYSFIRGNLPLKILAVRSGLSQYGRNNISYISGMGSFYRLTALISDMPCDNATWQDIQMMPHCDNCWACLNNCPTKCIDIKQKIIDASRCLTYINENSEPFPVWINGNWHNSLVGCIRCQLACPQNRNQNMLTDYRDILDESDIDELLHANDFTKLPSKLCEALKKINLNDYEIITLQRNLKALLKY